MYLLPANLDLSAMEMNLVSTMNRERVLKGYVDKVKKNFDFVIIRTRKLAKSSFDHTNWFCFTEYGENLMEGGEQND